MSGRILKRTEVWTFDHGVCLVTSPSDGCIMLCDWLSVDVSWCVIGCPWMYHGVWLVVRGCIMACDWSPGCVMETQMGADYCLPGVCCVLMALACPGHCSSMGSWPTSGLVVWVAPRGPATPCWGHTLTWNSGSCVQTRPDNGHLFYNPASQLAAGAEIRDEVSVVWPIVSGWWCKGCHIAHTHTHINM
jgi:hypothetical protein